MTSTILVGLAALVAGAVNAIAGGGSLISFPALVAAGVPPVIASLTNTVAMCPGYLGATLSQRRDLVGQGRRAAGLLPFAGLGGVIGALLLLRTGEASFDAVVPWLLLFAAALLALQDHAKRLVGRGGRTAILGALLVGLAAIYGGYFGAGMGAIVVASLAIVFDDSFTRINALKQTVSLVTNVAAAVVFLWSGRVDWSFAAVMLACSLVGGALGGLVASRIPARLLRWVVIVAGVAIALIYLLR